MEVVARADATASVTSEELEKLLGSALEEGNGRGRREEEVVAEALRAVFPSSMHVVVGEDVTAAVRIQARSRTLLKVTMNQDPQLPAPP